MSKSVHRSLLAFIAIEHRDQFRDLQLVAHALGKLGQLDLASEMPRRGVDPDRGPKPAAVNIADAAQVDDNLLFPLQQTLHQFPELRSLFAENDTTAATDHGNATGLASRDLQSHTSPPSAQRATKRRASVAPLPIVFKAGHTFL